MDKDLEELKKVFRALAVSSPVQVDVRSLLKDYRNMMGHMVPIHKWGYKDPLHFLKERSKHKGKRRSVPESLLTPKPSLIADTFKVVKEETPLPHNNHTPNRKTTEKQDNKQNRNPNNNVQEPKKEVERDIPKENGDLPSPEKFKCFFQKRRSCHNSRQSVHTDITCNNVSKTPEKEDDDSGRQSASTTGSSSGSKMAKIDKLKREIMELISAHPNGVWCADLIRLYRERYKRELAFSQFGYISILSLVCELDVTVSRPQGVDDWWLCHPGLVALVVPPPPGAAAPKGRAPKPRSVDPEDALPGIQYDEDVFPSDCIHFTESIPSLSVQGLSPGAMVDVVLGEVYSPSHFWFIRLGDAFSIAMDEIMDDMTQYYSNGEGKERHLGLGAVRVGQYCASVFDGDYHRSLIVKVIDSDTVKVRHVDYGTVDTQSVYRLKPLLRRWAALPAQATRARLAGLRPTAGGRRWPHAASAFFLDVVRNKKFVANVLAVDPEDNVVEVILIDTSTDEDICIGTEIIKAGHADARADSALRVSPPSSDGPPCDVRSLLTTVESLHAGKRHGELDRSDSEESCSVSEFSCSVSEISCSASEVVGRVPRRMPRWECPEERFDHLLQLKVSEFENRDIDAACDTLLESSLDGFLPASSMALGTNKELAVNDNVSTSSFASRLQRWKCAKRDNNIYNEIMTDNNLKTDINSNNIKVTHPKSSNVEKILSNHTPTVSSITSKLLYNKLKEKYKITHLNSIESSEVSQNSEDRIIPRINDNINHSHDNINNNCNENDIDKSPVSSVISGSGFSCFRLARLSALHSQLRKSDPETSSNATVIGDKCSDSDSNVSFSSQLLRRKLDMYKRLSNQISVTNK
ncbi:hypothetical protein K1T71_010029 [Dendrolimus kikuchii]|uniref:Uncharacterized protein n=1 Tax=Dendrolimus kikuchii TaxID=765133 RepID=A0ACC1CQH8_9NEOP|nr:hypothetical protein K1T71_010029 [Dendrolimus kikuchii]